MYQKKSQKNTPKILSKLSMCKLYFMGNLPKVVVENKSIPSMCSPPNISKQIKSKVNKTTHL